MNYDPLTPLMVIEGHVLTWDGRADPVTVIDQSEERLLVETTTGDQLSLTAVADGLALENTDEPLENPRVIGTMPWRKTKILADYYEEKLGRDGQKIQSAVEYAEQTVGTIAELNRQLAELQADPRSTVSAVRCGYHTWLIYNTRFQGNASLSELADSLTDRELVETASIEDDTVVVTFDEAATTVPLLVAHLVYDAGWAIASVIPHSTDDPLTMTVTRRPEATTP
ncbi:hypothetical protein [Halobaculum magnesiiphilum]|uniref:Uncharacterized protein n=1 Tax=Halobaculum magnesiiphilum TaxID=1017351 RepID=A0A8T8WEH4_9EURY|nr:hypothetical protein [Halobaculum magnesiiphilum]QZP38262.1 hypothetical protein K6T50_03655 [Halobaculum magnesiiphilum]